MRLNFTAVPLLLLFQLLFSRFISAQEAVSDEQIPLIQTNESSDPAVLMIRDKENSINDSCINMPAVREENVAVNAFEEYDDDDDEDDYDDDEEDDDYDDFPLNFNEWGKPQIIRDEAVEARIQSTRRYMEEVIFAGTHEGKYECRNDHIECSAWASRGMCETNEEYMVQSCSPACQTCQEYFEQFYDDEWEDVDEDQPNSQEEHGSILPSIWGVPQSMGNTLPMSTLQKVLDATNKYMTESILPNTQEYNRIARECQNKHSDCTFWAAEGQCDQNPAYMHLLCAPACQTCDHLDYKKRCPMPTESFDAFKAPGELNAMFQRIVTDPIWQDNYGPVEILSSPETTGGPWIVSLETFLNEEECNRFIHVGAEVGYERSMDVASEEEFDGSFGSEESDGRTSTNAWCNHDCYEDPIVGPVHKRVEALTEMHYNYSEFYQLLRYEPGQFYEEHHDYITAEQDRPHGPRVLTVFMYLNDVEEGGGTHFGRLNLTSVPKKGKAIIWPSVLDEDPVEWDERTHHEALPVKSGIKYGANAWIHLRDFKTQWAKGCS